MLLWQNIGSVIFSQVRTFNIFCMKISLSHVANWLDGCWYVSSYLAFFPSGTHTAHVQQPHLLPVSPPDDSTLLGEQMARWMGCLPALCSGIVKETASAQRSPSGEPDKGSYRSVAGSQEISCTCKASITQLTEREEDITLISVMNTRSVKNEITDTAGWTHVTAVREEPLCLDARWSDQRKPDVDLHFWNIRMHWNNWYDFRPACFLFVFYQSGTFLQKRPSFERNNSFIRLFQTKPQFGWIS